MSILHNPCKSKWPGGTTPSLEKWGAMPLCPPQLVRPRLYIMYVDVMQACTSLTGYVVVTLQFSPYSPVHLAIGCGL